MAVSKIEQKTFAITLLHIRLYNAKIFHQLIFAKMITLLIIKEGEGPLNQRGIEESESLPFMADPRNSLFREHRSLFEPRMHSTDIRQARTQPYSTNTTQLLGYGQDPQRNRLPYQSEFEFQPSQIPITQNNSRGRLQNQPENRFSPAFPGPQPTTNRHIFRDGLPNQPEYHYYSDFQKPSVPCNYSELDYARNQPETGFLMRTQAPQTSFNHANESVYANSAPYTHGNHYLDRSYPSQNMLPSSKPYNFRDRLPNQPDLGYFSDIPQSRTRFGNQPQHVFHKGVESQFRNNPGNMLPNQTHINQTNLPSWRNNSFNSNRRNSQKIKPPSFDGQSHEWPYFKRLFCEAASINEWTESEQRYNLLNNLHGEARSFIVSIENQLSYLSVEGIIHLMNNRFGVGNQTHHFQSLLDSKIWKWGENVRTYVDEIRRLVALAYPQVQGWSHQEVLVRKQFINGIQDNTLRQKLMIDPPETVESAVQFTERYIAAKQFNSSRATSFSSRDRVRMVRPSEDSDSESESESDDEINQMVFQVSEMLNKTVKDMKKSKFRKTRNFGKRKFDKSRCKCFNCGVEGHFKDECPDLNSEKSPAKGKEETQ